MGCQMKRINFFAHQIKLLLIGCDVRTMLAHEFFVMQSKRQVGLGTYIYFLSDQTRFANYLYGDWMVELRNQLPHHVYQITEYKMGKPRPNSF